MASAYSSGAVLSAIVRIRAESGVSMPSATLAIDIERRGVSIGEEKMKKKQHNENKWPANRRFALKRNAKVSYLIYCGCWRNAYRGDPQHLRETSLPGNAPVLQSAVTVQSLLQLAQPWMSQNSLMHCKQA